MNAKEARGIVSNKIAQEPVIREFMEKVKETAMSRKVDFKFPGPADRLDSYQLAYLRHLGYGIFWNNFENCYDVSFGA